MPDSTFFSYLIISQVIKILWLSLCTHKIIRKMVIIGVICRRLTEYIWLLRYSKVLKNPDCSATYIFKVDRSNPIHLSVKKIFLRDTLVPKPNNGFELGFIYISTSAVLYWSKQKKAYTIKHRVYAVIIKHHKICFNLVQLQACSYCK